MRERRNRRRPRPARQCPGGLGREALERMCFRNLLANPEERVFFKDLDSRFLLVSTGFLLEAANGRSLDEVIGKSDFDLFSDEHALAAYEDEQRIIQYRRGPGGQGRARDLP